VSARVSRAHIDSKSWVEELERFKIESVPLKPEFGGVRWTNNFIPYQKLNLDLTL